MNYYYSMHEEIAAIEWSMTRWIIDLSQPVNHPDRVVKIG